MNPWVKLAQNTTKLILHISTEFQAEGSGEDVGPMTEEETEVQQGHDQFLRTIERLIKPSARKKHVIGGEKKKNWGGGGILSTRRNGQEPLSVAEKPFPAVVRLDTT